MKAVTVGRAIGLATITATGLTIQLSPAPARSSGGALAIVAPRIGSLAAVSTPAIVTPAIISPAAIGSSAVVRASRVDVGGVSAAPAAIPSTSTARAPTLMSAGVVTIAPPLLGSAAAARAPDVSVGGVAVTPASIGPTSVAGQPIVSAAPAGSIQPPAIAAAASLHGLMVGVGAVTVSVAALPAGSSVAVPAVVAGAAGVAVPIIAPVGQAPAPAVSSGEVVIAPPPMSSAAAARTPAILVGEAGINLPAISAATTVSSPSISPGSVAVAPAAIPTSSVASPPVVSTGSVAVSPPRMAATSTARMPALSPGAVAISPALLASTSLTRSPSINVAAVYDIILMPTCSFGVGVYPRDAQDTDFSNVHQWRTRAPTGVSTDTTPLDQAIAPDGTDYLSIAERIGKEWVERTGNKVLLVPHSWNGTALISNGHLWQPGDSLHEAAITRTNAAIAATGGRLAAIVAWESGLANDDGSYQNQNLTKAMAVDALTATIASYRSKITGATNVPVILGSLVPERIASSNQAGNPGSQIFTDAISDVAVAGTNVFFVNIRPGYSDDNLHLNNAGIRFHAPLFANIVADVTAPVIGTASTAQAADGSPIAVQLTANKSVTWSIEGADAAAFEINRTFGTGGAGNINSTVATFTLRLKNNANASYANKASYSVMARARDGAGNVTTKALTITVAQPYGQGDQGPTTLTHNFSAEASGGYAGSPYTIANVPTDGGLALIFIYANGSTTAINSVTYKGVAATRLAMQSGGDIVQVWSAIVGAGAGTLTIAHSGSRDFLALEVATLTGTKASPTGTANVLGWGYHNSPVESTASLTCPSGGIIVGMGRAEAQVDSAVAGTTLAGKGTTVFAAYRKTTGKVSVNHSGGNYSAIASLVFEKSV